ncbi:lipid A deacylase LpxR family protein [Corallococcus macrosporus]|uniref:Outer membrane protein n=1 Tax=Myxococcus fulvus (strain ATCC BAA-855 / HW-1) TaxID=483219 RepID=F8CES7_MYXFH|nr:lipid A deacylase LpxR family protein [Corallococcus macrosporus]AEI67332.1 hypothetical protein LILAB_27225 [Corallococcus macrosporus]
MLKALALLTASWLAQAEEKLPFVTSLHFENDVLAKSDRLYTNGVRLEHYGEYDGCRSIARTLRLPAGVEHRYLCGGSLAQNMYTPSRIVPLPDQAVFPDPNDRPYGGWLHGGILFQHIRAGREPADSSRLTLQATVGVTGPASGAAQTQRWLHRTLNNLFGHTVARIPVGWEKQLPTEPAFHFSALHEQPLLWSPVVDVTWSAGAMLGTVFVNGSLGGTVRVGYLARPYGLAPIMPSVLEELEERRVRRGEPRSEALPLRDERAWEAYLYARGQVRVVARNLFLDGTLFRPSISVRKAPIVGDSEFGAAFRTGGFQFGLGMVFRSQEMADPPNPLLSGHRFTQIQLSYLH